MVTGFIYPIRSFLFENLCVTGKDSADVQCWSTHSVFSDYQMIFFFSPCFSLFLLSHIHTQNWLSGQPPSFRPIHPQLIVFLPKVALEVTAFQAGHHCVLVTLLCRQKVKQYCFVMIIIIMIIVNISTGQILKKSV